MTDKLVPHLALVKRQGAEFILLGAAPTDTSAEQAIQAMLPDAEFIAALSVSHFIDAALLHAAQDLYDAVHWGRDTDQAMLVIRRCISQSQTRSLSSFVDHASREPFALPIAPAA